MKTSVETSTLLHHRASHVVPERIKDMRKVFCYTNLFNLAQWARNGFEFFEE